MCPSCPRPTRRSVQRSLSVLPLWKDGSPEENTSSLIREVLKTTGDSTSGHVKNGGIRHVSTATAQSRSSIPLESRRRLPIQQRPSTRRPGSTQARARQRDRRQAGSRGGIGVCSADWSTTNPETPTQRGIHQCGASGSWDWAGRSRQPGLRHRGEAGITIKPKPMASQPSCDGLDIEDLQTACPQDMYAES